MRELNPPAAPTGTPLPGDELLTWLVDAIETPALTKADLAELLFERIGLNKREAKDMVDAFFDAIAGALQAGQEVKLTGFGNFQTRTKSARPGRNPRTGEQVQIEARRVTTFHASNKLKAQIQGTASLPSALSSAMPSPTVSGSVE